MTETGKTLLNLGLTALVSAGTNVVVNELSKSGADRSASVGGNVDIEALKVQLKEYLISSLEQDAILSSRLRGQQGPKGDKGDTGDEGLDGELIQNYGGSLLQNSALENVSSNNYVGGTIVETYKGFDALQFTSLTHNFLIKPNSESLYKLELYIKGIGTLNAFGFSFKKDLSSIVKSNGSYGSYFIQNKSINSNSFIKQIGYVGGEGNASMNFAPNCVNFKLRIDASSNLIVTKILLTKVDLGEPVPFNITFLPEGQMVYDPTDGSVGRYDGTTIHWFTMA